MAELNCTPALSKYCANIHVGCAGRSNLDTQPFTLLMAEIAAYVLPGEQPVLAGLTRDDTSAVIRPEGTNDWVRIEHQNDTITYSQRIYRNGRALMTRGTCVHPEQPDDKSDVGVLD